MIRAIGYAIRSTRRKLVTVLGGGDTPRRCRLEWAVTVRPLLRAEGESDAIRPPETILGRVFPSARSPIQVDDVVLLGHAASCRICLSVERQPAIARLV